MPVDNAFVDRLQTIRLVKQPDPKIEGRSTYITEYGPWIPCRIYTPTFLERRGDEAFEYQRDVSAIVSLEAEDGTPTFFNSSDKVNVESSAFGNDEYEVVGDQEPIRKLEEMVMWKLALRKYSSSPVTPSQP